MEIPCQRTCPYKIPVLLVPAVRFAEAVHSSKSYKGRESGKLEIPWSWKSVQAVELSSVDDNTGPQ